MIILDVPNITNRKSIEWEEWFQPLTWAPI